MASERLRVLEQRYPGEVDPVALAAGAARAVSMVEKAGDLEIPLSKATGAFLADLTVTNNCGHKLPTGYPEGRGWAELRHTILRAVVDGP